MPESLQSYLQMLNSLLLSHEVTGFFLIVPSLKAVMIAAMKKLFPWSYLISIISPQSHSEEGGRATKTLENRSEQLNLITLWKIRKGWNLRLLTEVGQNKYRVESLGVMMKPKAANKEGHQIYSNHRSHRIFAFSLIDSIKPDHHLYFISSPDISGIIRVRNYSLMWMKVLQSSPMFGCYISIYISCPFRFGAPWERITQERIGCDSSTIIMSLIQKSLSVKKKYLYLYKNIRFYVISFEFRQNGCFPMEYFIHA